MFWNFELSHPGTTFKYLQPEYWKKLLHGVFRKFFPKDIRCLIVGPKLLRPYNTESHQSAEVLHFDLYMHISFRHLTVGFQGNFGCSVSRKKSGNHVSFIFHMCVLNNICKHPSYPNNLFSTGRKCDIIRLWAAQGNPIFSLWGRLYRRGVEFYIYSIRRSSCLSKFSPISLV